MRVYNRPIVHPERDASKSRNGPFIPMIEILLYASMTCNDAADLIGRVRKNENTSELIRTEVVETLKEATPQCNWDAND